MAKRVSVDGWLFAVTMLLMFIGLVMVFSASAVIAKDRYGSGYYFLLRQMIWAVGGIAAMTVAMKVDYHRLKHPAVVFTVLGVTTSLLIGVFLLDRSHNTHRWIHWGGFSFQPSELAKPALILFLAFFLESRTRVMDDWRNTLLPRISALPSLAPPSRCAFSSPRGWICAISPTGLQLRFCRFIF
jgi:cell division protein FtsW